MARVVLEGDCWIWTGRSTTQGGYGNISTPGSRRAYVHIVAYEHHHGPLAEGHYVAHTCDVPLCVNPAHLRAATQAENLADMVAKGRSNRGEKHWNWKGGASKNYRTGRNRTPGKLLE